MVSDLLINNYVQFVCLSTDNLDPKKRLTDLEIWQAVEQCEGKAIILKLGNY